MVQHAHSEDNGKLIGVNHIQSQLSGQARCATMQMGIPGAAVDMTKGKREWVTLRKCFRDAS